MKFNDYNIGNQPRGAVVEVTLKGSAANVRLLDNANFQKYKNGRKHTCYGGLVKRSPAHITVPRSGSWHVVVDMQGLRGRTSSSVRVIHPEAQSPLPEYRPQSQVAPLFSMVRPAIQENSSNHGAAQYDVFICYASEDKDDFVRPLADALIAEGLSVWYDDLALRIGDNLRRKIDDGIAQSRFGVVILSHAFFTKGWPQYELDGLVTRERNGEQSMAILPIWHRISKDDVMKYSSSLVNKVARNTSEHIVKDIAREIADVIRGD